MVQPTSPIISINEVLGVLNQANTVVLDASNSPNGKRDYLNQHLAGAIWVDLNHDLSALVDNASKGGRHPLPTVESFCKTIGKWGIDSESNVLIYDRDGGAMAAARCWWMIRATGHRNVWVVDGGFQSLIHAGLKMVSGHETAVPKNNFHFTSWTLPTVNIQEVSDSISNPQKLIIDVREPERYHGITEPIDLVAGHIPGAKNLFYKNAISENGYFLSPTEMQVKFAPFIADKKVENIILHCGSGVTACHTILALAHAGIGIPSLYVGSWSEWSRNEKEIVVS